MADQSDVEQALAAVVAAVLYPSGTSAASLVGVACRVHRGWPDAASLDADLLAGRVRVSVSAVMESQRATTRYPDGWQPMTPVSPALTIAVTGTTATLGGSADVGQLAGLRADGAIAVHRTVPDDTLPGVAAALAAAFPAGFGAHASGGVVTVPDAVLLLARVVADQPAIRETRRQCQGFRVACWCPDPTLRDSVGAAIDAALSAMDFLGLPDGMAGRLRFMASKVSDRAQDAALYRRDLLYSVDYATTLQRSQPCFLFGATGVVPNGVLAETLLS